MLTVLELGACARGSFLQRTWSVFEECSTMIVEPERTPLRWHCSEGVPLRKAPISGPRGRRVVHKLDFMGKGFFGKKIRHCSPPPMSPYDYGFLRHRRREGAIAVQNISQWRPNQAGRSSALDNHDMSNAFGSSDWTALSDACCDFFLPADVKYSSQRYEWASCWLPCSSGWVLSGTSSV